MTTLLTAKRLFLEFWCPFSLAVAWTIYTALAAGPLTVPILISTFGAAFFLFSWATGQVVRVRRQAKVEGALTDVEDRLGELFIRLDGATNRLVGSVTGGDAFAYISLMEIGPALVSSGRRIQTNFAPMLVHVGDYPLSNVQVRMYDVQQGRDHSVTTLGACNPLVAQVGGGAPVSLSDSSEQDYNIFFYAKNGLWVQLLKMRLVNDEWRQASVVVRDDAMIYGHVPLDFPIVGDEKFDNFRGRGDEPHFLPSPTTALRHKSP